MSIPNLNFYSLQSTFYCKKLKSCRHDAVKSEKKTPVYAMSKGRLHFFGNCERFSAIRSGGTHLVSTLSTMRLNHFALQL